MSRKRALVGVLVIVVVLVVTAGIILIGLPSEERARRIDQRRVTDLRRISSAMDVYYTRHQRLPAALDELAAEPGVTIAIADGETGQRYEYAVRGMERYQLCTSFNGDARERAFSDFWSHGAGRQCFELTVKSSRPDGSPLPRREAQRPGEQE